MKLSIKFLAVMLSLFASLCITVNKAEAATISGAQANRHNDQSVRKI